MAAVNNPYLRSWENYDEESYLPIKVAHGEPIFVTKDGKVKARGFIDYNDDIELYMDKDLIKSRHVISDKVFRNCVFNKNDEYVYTLTMAEQLDECFQNYLNPVHFYNNTEPQNPVHKKYKFLSAKTRGAVESRILSSNQIPKSFQWGFRLGNHVHVEPETEGAWFGPYNYDVYLSAESSAHDINDLIVIKSGSFNRLPPEEVDYYNAAVHFSTGVSGHVYVTTPSLPKHPYGPFSGPVQTPNSEPLRYKIPRTGNSNQGQVVSHSGISEGPVGILKNGVFVHSPMNRESYADSGVWNENAAFVESAQLKKDACGGYVQENTVSPNFSVYHYKGLPRCMYDLSNVSHSPLLGFAMDGHPIYGPLGYASENDSSSAIKRLDASYRLKQVANRPGTDAPSFSDFASGYFLEDYEYVAGLGDLDEHNGRSCVTPEYPQGTYAYFATVDQSWQDAYPYIVGPTYFGDISENIGLGKPVTEPLFSRVPYLSDSQRQEMYVTTPDIGEWLIYSDTHYTTDGLQGENIIWVSPHVLKEAQGVFLTTGYEQYLTSTGEWNYTTHTGSGMATYSGNRYMATGNGEFLAYDSPFIYPTSKEMTLLKGFPFSGGMTFLYTNPDTDSAFSTTSPLKIEDTEFYEIYSGHRRVSGKVNKGHWDGKIPAGTPFKIEAWAFNGYEVGFQGRVNIWPCEPHELTSGNMISIVSHTSGIGGTEGEAYQNAVDKGKKILNKRLNTLLVQSGIKKERASMRRYKKFMARESESDRET